MAVGRGVVVTSDDTTSFPFTSGDYLLSCLLPSSVDLFELMRIYPPLQRVVILIIVSSVSLSNPHMFREDDYVFVVFLALVVVGPSR